MNLCKASSAVIKAAVLRRVYKPVCGRESGEISASYLVKVFLLLLYFGNVEQQTPHLPSELEGNSLIDPPDQLEGNKQQVVIVRKRPSKEERASSTSETPSTFRADPTKLHLS